MGAGSAIILVLITILCLSPPHHNNCMSTDVDAIRSPATRCIRHRRLRRGLASKHLLYASRVCVALQG